MPYFTVETRTFLMARSQEKQGEIQDQAQANAPYSVLSKLLDEYGPQSHVEDQRHTMHIPQTLDQSYSRIARYTTEQDTDQVIYRWTKAEEDRKKMGGLKKITKEAHKEEAKTRKTEEVFEINGEGVSGEENTAQQPVILLIGQIWLWKVNSK